MSMCKVKNLVVCHRCCGGRLSNISRWPNIDFYDGFGPLFLFFATISWKQKSPKPGTQGKQGAQNVKRPELAGHPVWDDQPSWTILLRLQKRCFPEFTKTRRKIQRHQTEYQIFAHPRAPVEDTSDDIENKRRTTEACTKRASANPHW